MRSADNYWDFLDIGCRSALQQVTLTGYVGPRHRKAASHMHGTAAIYFS